MFCVGHKKSYLKSKLDENENLELLFYCDVLCSKFFIMFTLSFSATIQSPSFYPTHLLSSFSFSLLRMKILRCFIAAAFILHSQMESQFECFTAVRENFPPILVHYTDKRDATWSCNFLLHCLWLLAKFNGNVEKLSCIVQQWAPSEKNSSGRWRVHWAELMLMTVEFLFLKTETKM